ncbi:glycosyltransferase family 4 protein (plasmid) [Skermanella sp. TT6]|uniref:Glycosyltransferase family 4 protein n=1 Tax=Skermanella cutis TaxID=2775420 RepID=A0ABX7BH53_9PROT|nr:glycosyltransferase family 4 protein [Skermanella sp. TT6]
MPFDSSGFLVEKARVAVIHDWLYTYGGAERVLEQILAVFPNADVFSLFDTLPDDQRGFLGGRKVRTSFIQKLVRKNGNHRFLLPLMPLAIEQFDLSDYDLVISSSYAVAKGVITGPRQFHVSYVHSPMRYAWDLQHEYLRNSKLTSGAKAWMAKLLLHKMRLWDIRTSNSVDSYIANSNFVAQRVWKLYRRPAKVISPPVNVDRFRAGESKGDFYFTASRLVQYKRIDLIAEAFSRTPERRLVIAGEGPEMRRIQALAGPNVEILGHVDSDRLTALMQQARAFVFAAEEDFGIVPLEAQACGTPVIAYGRGGALETVRGLLTSAQPTGMFFNHQTSDSLVEAVDLFEQMSSRITPQACRANALRFGEQRFRDDLLAFIGQEFDRHVQHYDGVRPEPMAEAEWVEKRLVSHPGHAA